MDDFLTLAKKRYSCRDFKQVPITDEVLAQVLEAARIAPSAVNFQPWKFIVIREPENLKKAYDFYHRDWFNTAPCVVVVCANHEQSWKRKADNKDFADVDVAIAIDHLTLKATQLGLSTCWVCNFYVDKTKEELKLPDFIEPIALIPIGYPNDTSNPDRHNTKRKTLDEIVQWEF